MVPVCNIEYSVFPYELCKSVWLYFDFIQIADSTTPKTFEVIGEAKTMCINIDTSLNVE